MAQKRFGIDLKNGKAISGAGVFVLVVSLLVFMPAAVLAVTTLATRRLDVENVATAIGLLVGPVVVVFCIGRQVLKLFRVPFIRPSSDLYIRSSQDLIDELWPEDATRARKVWWVWRVFAGLMGSLLIGAAVVGFVEGNRKALLLLSVGIPARVYVAILGRDV